MITQQLKLPMNTASVKDHPELRQPGVYAIVHRRSGRTYVGSTSRSAGVITRLNEHRSKLRSGRHPSRRLQFEFTKYGIEAFDFWLLESCSADEAKQREQTYLDQHRPDSYNTLQSVTEYRPYSPDACRLIADKASKPFALEFGGVAHTGKNLSAFCRERRLHQGAMTQVLLGKKPQYKGWTLPGRGVAPVLVRNELTGEELSVAYFGGNKTARQLGLNEAWFNKLLRGELPSYRGWQVIRTSTTPPRRRRIDPLRRAQ